MRNLFFYGTLRHEPLLEIVLDRPADKLDLQRREIKWEKKNKKKIKEETNKKNKRK